MENYFKENRLAFKEGEPAPKPEAEAPVVPEKPEVLKARVELKMEAVKARMAEIRKAAAGTYDAELVQEAAQHEDRMKKIDLSKPEDKEYLEKTDKDLDHVTSEFSEENIKAVKEVKAQLEVEKKNFAQRKVELLAETKKIAAEIKFKKEYTDKEISDSFDEVFSPIEGLLNYSRETDLGKLKRNLETVQGFLKVSTPENFRKSIMKHKEVLVEISRLEKLGGDGKQAKVEMEKISKEVLGDFTKEASVDAKDIKEKHEQEVIMARVCDILNAKKGPADPEITPENIKSALRYYELGKHESGQEKDDAKKIIDLLVANKNELLKAGIKMDLLGGTDSTDHKLTKSKAYHDAKASALKKLLAFHDAGKLNVAIGSIDLVDGSATRKLIEEYVAETDNTKRYEIVKAHREDFLSGGKIFDAALCLQRAEDMKKRIDIEESGLTIELGAEQKDEYRKSGISFSETTPEAEKKDVDHGYIYNSKTQELTVKNKDTAEIKTYKINAPKDTEISTVESDDGDFFVEVVLNGKKTYFDFDEKGELVAETYGDDKGKETDLLKTHEVKSDGKNINIKPKAPEAKPAPKTEPAVQPPVAPAPATVPDAATPSQAPDSAPPAPSAPAENAAAKELNITLGAAKLKVEEKMKAVEDTIDKDETWVTKGTAKEKMAKSKADFKETFAKVRGLLGEAESFAKQNKPKEAKAKYEEAQTLLNEKLKKAQEKDSLEVTLADTTNKKIKELRDEIAAQKKNVDVAFDKLK